LQGVFLASRIELGRKLELEGEYSKLQRLQGRAEQLRILSILPFEIDKRIQEFLLREEQERNMSERQRLEHDRKLAGRN